MSFEHESELIEQARLQAAKARVRAADSSAPGWAPSGSSAGGGFDAALPKYEIHRELHRGGQGVVYFATQRATRRDVAIKFLRQGPLAGQSERARFEREIEILGTFRHPGIVTIHDSGIARSGFYYVMDFVDGVPVDEYVRKNAIGPRDALALLLKICDAVGAAHLRGIIHRDLKPGNILVDANAQPHILDFGLAKLASDADSSSVDMTQTGQFIGSLPWASPEQADGKHKSLDIRSDVYSLGVLAYRILTGQSPYELSGSWREVTGRILSAIPKPPRTISPRIDSDVETIVLKCLEKDPERRYQSAGELSADIRRYLNGEPIAAKRDSALYVLRKTLRRYRLAVGVAASFVILIAASAVTLGVLYKGQIAERKRAEEQTVLAQQERDRARQYADEARSKFQMARDSATFMLDQVSRRLLNVAGASDLRKDLLTRAYEQLSKLTLEAPDDPQLQYEIARTHYRLAGFTRNELSDAKKADEHQKTATAIADQLLLVEPANPRYMALRAGFYAAEGQVKENARDYAGARALYDREHELAQGVMQLLPDDPASTQRLCSSYGRLTTLSQREGKLDEAARWLSQAVPLAARLVEMEPGKAEHEYYTVLCESRLADLEVERREPSQAQENYRSAIQRTERLLARDSNNSSYLITLSYCSGRLGESLWRTDQPDEARQWLERRLEVNRRITSLEPRNLTYQAMVADACVKLSRVCLQSGRHEQASPLADEAIRLLRPLTEREAPNVALREALACSLSISGRAVLQSGDAPTAKNRLAEAQAVFGGLESNRPVNLYSLLDHAEALSVLAGLGAESAQPEVEAQHGQTAQSLFKAAADEATRIGDTALAERCMARTRTGQLGGGAGTP